MIRIGIDLGGTAVKTGLFTEDGALFGRMEFPTVKDSRAALLADIAEHIRALTAEHSVALSDCAAGIGVPGPVEEDGYTEAIPNLGIHDCYLGRELSDLLGIPVRILNDANAAALGEYWLGAGRGSKSMICVTLGTGVGAGIILNGQVLGGAHGLGGEIGHMFVNPDETQACSCGATGCLDQVASASGVARYAKTLYDLPYPTAKDVCDAAKAGDSQAEATLRYCMSFLGKALCLVGYTVDPELAVIGGGLSKAGPYLLDIIYDAYKDLPKLTAKRMEFRLAELGNDAGMTGAARLASR
jgi:glucokinase